jgi:hypothetical protein
MLTYLVLNISYFGQLTMVIIYYEAVKYIALKKDYES